MCLSVCLPSTDRDPTNFQVDNSLKQTIDIERGIDRTTNSRYARQFIEENHKFVNLVENYEIIKIVNNTNKKTLMEEILKEKDLNNLMNVKINFDNEEIFYLILKTMKKVRNKK